MDNNIVDTVKSSSQAPFVPYYNTHTDTIIFAWKLCRVYIPQTYRYGELAMLFLRNWVLATNRECEEWIHEGGKITGNK